MQWQQSHSADAGLCAPTWQTVALTEALLKEGCS